MTFTVLRALHAIIGEALDDMERVYAEHSSSAGPSRMPASPSTPISRKGSDNGQSFGNGYASPPPSPSVSGFSQATSSHSTPRFGTPVPLDFPSLDSVHDPTSPSETLTSHPTVISAINRIVAAAGQMNATVQKPFLTLCDASMGVGIV